MKNYFAVLGFDIQEADELLRGNWEETLKGRYRLLTRAVHPDKVAGWDDLQAHIDRKELSDYANGLQAELNEAYETLSDQGKRNQYLVQIVNAAGRRGVFEISKMQAIMKYASIVKNNSD
jgi:DnaJ-class molecular chaperone